MRAMTPEQFERSGRKLFGLRWKPPLSRALGIDYVTVWRYATGQSAIPTVVALAVDYIMITKPKARRKKISGRGAAGSAQARGA